MFEIPRLGEHCVRKWLAALGASISPVLVSCYVGEPSLVANGTFSFRLQVFSEDSHSRDATEPCPKSNEDPMIARLHEMVLT